MNLEIRAFADAGDLSKERIVLKALTDVDVGDYAILRSGVASGGGAPTSGRKAAYWFADVEVKANDVIVLYTKKGSRSSKLLDSGRTAHFFYWGKDEPLWADQKFGAVLVEITNWQFEVPGT
jgi:hypothetical protein